MGVSVAGRRTKILVLTSEAGLSRLVRSILEPGCRVTAGTSPPAKPGTNGHAFDVVIVDLQTVDLQRIARLKRARPGAQILAICREYSETDCIAVLDADADYLARPFREHDLAARVRVAELRQFNATGRRRLYRNGSFVFDLFDGKAVVNGGEIVLTPSELSVLTLLAGEPGAVATYDRLTSGMGLLGGSNRRHALRSCIFRLRRKIEPDALRPRIVLAEAGVGYRLAAAADEPPRRETQPSQGEEMRSCTT
jgi:two-component system KDP operon response regulator KdpE